VVVEVVLKVKGMTCTMCAMHVRKALENLNGVDRANVDFKKNRAMIVYDETTVSLEEMRKAVHEAGYKLILKEKQKNVSSHKPPAKFISLIRKLFHFPPHVHQADKTGLSKEE